MTATSSALAERTAPPFDPAAAAAGEPEATWPNAPKRTFAIDRFIARPIRIVSRVPEAPTSMPLTISTLFSSSKPVAAAARPVNAFSSEITTGMSAPPIGRTKRTPKTSEPPISAARSHWFSTPAAIATPAAAIDANRSPFTICCPGYTIGRPLISSWSFANATMLPAKETLPISADRTIVALMSYWRCPGRGARR